MHTLKANIKQIVTCNRSNLWNCTCPTNFVAYFAPPLKGLHLFIENMIHRWHAAAINRDNQCGTGMYLLFGTSTLSMFSVSELSITVMEPYCIFPIVGDGYTLTFCYSHGPVVSVGADWRVCLASQRIRFHHFYYAICYGNDAAPATCILPRALRSEPTPHLIQGRRSRA